MNWGYDCWSILKNFIVSTMLTKRTMSSIPPKLRRGGGEKKTQGSNTIMPTSFALKSHRVAISLGLLKSLRVAISLELVKSHRVAISLGLLKSHRVAISLSSIALPKTAAGVELRQWFKYHCHCLR